MTRTLFLLCVGLAACSSAPAGSVIADDAAAIQTAKVRCAWKPMAGQFEKWHAVLRQGIWHVWLSLEPGTQAEPTLRDDPDYDFLDVHIRASDGADGGCAMSVG